MFLTWSTTSQMRPFVVHSGDNPWHFHINTNHTKLVVVHEICQHSDAASGLNFDFSKWVFEVNWLKLTWLNLSFYYDTQRVIIKSLCSVSEWSTHEMPRDWARSLLIIRCGEIDNIHLIIFPTVINTTHRLYSKIYLGFINV